MVNEMVKKGKKKYVNNKAQKAKVENLLDAMGDLPQVGPISIVDIKKNKWKFRGPGYYFLTQHTIPKRADYNPDKIVMYLLNNGRPGLEVIVTPAYSIDETRQQLAEYRLSKYNSRYLEQVLKEYR